MKVSVESTKQRSKYRTSWQAILVFMRLEGSVESVKIENRKQVTRVLEKKTKSTFHVLLKKCNKTKSAAVAVSLEDDGESTTNQGGESGDTAYTGNT